MKSMKRPGLSIDTELANEQYNERKNKDKDSNPFKVASDVKPPNKGPSFNKSSKKQTEASRNSISTLSATPKDLRRTRTTTEESSSTSQKKLDKTPSADM